MAGIGVPRFTLSDEFELPTNPSRLSSVADFADRLSASVVAPSPEGAAEADRFVEFVLSNSHLLADPVVIHGLLSAAHVHYLLGDAQSGLTPARLAVRAAQFQGDHASLRRALTFEGAMLTDGGNTPLALERYAEALHLAINLGEKAAEIAILNNIGLAFIYSALYPQAIACLERSLELAGGSPDFAALTELAAANIALASIHTEDLARGLRAAKVAVNSGAILSSPTDMYMRVLSERNYVRLLTEVENLEKAKDRVEIAKDLAHRSGLARADLQAALAEGLYEVHAGLIDVGLTRLEAALETAKANPPGYRDALLTIVKALQVAGQPDKALIFLRELKQFTQALQQDSALCHHRIHLAQLDSDLDGARDSTDGFFRRHERLIEGQQAQQRLLKAQVEQLERLSVTAELRDDDTGEHVYRVGRLASLLAEEAGVDQRTCFTIELAARLHDVGKIAIPDAILLKPGHLNAAEREIMETHTTVGAELLAKSDIPHMQVAEDIARHHHEWWAGGGYPTGISGEAIPIAARVTALADVFDALTHRRPYRDPWSVSRALEEIQRLSGTQFDPQLVVLFISLVRRLQREQGDLDDYLGAAARESSFNLARRKITDILHAGRLAPVR